MNKQILLIDDDEAVIKLLGSFLVSKGFKVETAMDGLEGLEKLRASTPSLIVLDVMMPRMDGYGFLREIKKDLKYRNIPTVVLTAREMMRDTFVQEGVTEYVVKPYDPEELLKAILKHLQP